MKTLIIPILALFIISPLTDINGQTTNRSDTVRNVDHSIGIAFGLTTGYGLAYRYNSRVFGFQFNFAPYFEESRKSINIGFTLLADLLVNEKTKLFLYQSNSYNYDKSVYYYYYSKEVNNYFHHGLGIGFEIFIHQKIGFNIMFGYGVYRNFHEVNLTGETGLFYKF